MNELIFQVRISLCQMRRVAILNERIQIRSVRTDHPLQITQRQATGFTGLQR